MIGGGDSIHSVTTGNKHLFRDLSGQPSKSSGKRVRSPNPENMVHVLGSLGPSCLPSKSKWCREAASGPCDRQNNLAVTGYSGVHLGFKSSNDLSHRAKQCLGPYQAGNIENTGLYRKGLVMKQGCTCKGAKWISQCSVIASC